MNNPHESEQNSTLSLSQLNAEFIKKYKPADAWDVDDADQESRNYKSFVIF